MSVRRDADGNIVEEKTKRADAFGREAGPDDPTVGKGPQPVPPAQPSIDVGPRVIPQQAGQPSGYEADTFLARSKPGDSQAQAAPESSYEAPTVPAGDAPVGQPALSDSAPEHRTRIYRPEKRPTTERPPEQPASPAETGHQPISDIMDDPLVGWLVVIQGPGQGHVVTIGNGSNSLGRDPGERICVDFGDETISRSGHTIIT